MDITLFLAQLWGPVALAVGLGLFISRSYYVRIYRDLEKAPFAVLCFGMLALAAGIAQVLSHNVWETLPQIVISVLGWALIVKGAICTIIPRWADKAADWALHAKVLPFDGIVLIIIGVYLSWIAYFV